MNVPVLPQRFVRIAQLVLLVFYAVGLVGILVRPDFFLPLSPFNLLLNLVLLLLFQEERNGHFMRFFVLVFAGGIGLELFGVRTGMLFGHYQYGASLGFRIGEVPLIIGVNWWLLTWTTMVIAERTVTNIYARAALGAALMVGLDVLIERVCSRLDFWTWADGAAPLRNYIAWFVIAFFFQFAGQQLQLHRRNPLAVAIFALQVIFFLVLNLVNFHS